MLAAKILKCLVKRDGGRNQTTEGNEGGKSKKSGFVNLDRNLKRSIFNIGIYENKV